jgi:hypothetical protein
MRAINTETLDQAARFYAGQFLRDPEWVMGQFHNFTYKDEFDYLVTAIQEYMAAKTKKEFARLSGSAFPARSEDVLKDLLRSKLAVDMDGGHIEGALGSVQVDRRLIGVHAVEVEAPWSLMKRKRLGLPKSVRETITKNVLRYWPIYAGEAEERAAGSDVVDDLPEGTPSLAAGALNTRISNEVAILMCDSAVDNLDEGTSNAVVTGRSGAQPTDPDTVASGTLLFTLACTDPAFGNASDAAPGATATASTVTADSSTDATATVGYCRASSTNDGSTPLDDHIDGEAGTSGADFNFNTVAIVTGANVELTAWTVTQPES